MAWRSATRCLGKSNGLRKILDLVMNYERGNWDEISREARNLGIADEVITERYLESVDWAQQVLSGHSVSELQPASRAGEPASVMSLVAMTD